MIGTACSNVLFRKITFSSWNYNGFWTAKSPSATFPMKSYLKSLFPIQSNQQYKIKAIEKVILKAIDKYDFWTDGDLHISNHFLNHFLHHFVFQQKNTSIYKLKAIANMIGTAFSNVVSPNHFFRLELQCFWTAKSPSATFSNAIIFEITFFLYNPIKHTNKKRLEK